MAVPLVHTTWLIRRNEPFSWAGQVLDANGAPVDLTGQTLTAKVRAGRGYDATEKLALTVAVTVAASGTYTVTATKELTAALAAGVLQSPPWWGEVWGVGSAFPNNEKLVEAQPVSVY